MVPLLWAGRISNQAYSPECVEEEFSEVRPSKESRFLLERAQQGFSHKNSEE
jgi:hypothetical protein